MNKSLRNLIKNLPLYKGIRSLRQKRVLAEWEAHGRPIPPPHIVKQKTLRDFAKQFRLAILVETGTYRGDMVEAMKPFFNQIYSIELSDQLYEEAKQRFKGEEKIVLIHGDSGTELGKLIDTLDQPALFWLDGHYSAGVTAKGDKETPIYEELRHIFNSKQRGHVIIIDDARCFGVEPDYPSIDELRNFVKANAPDAHVEVEDDNIRIMRV